jgi:predicted nuclease of predicted toxin-antitoxin system
LTTNLRVLIDEAVTDPLARELMSASCLNALYVRDIPALVEASDEAVMEYAKEEDRILITTETGINEKSFKICSHPGIIIFATRDRHESIQAKVFQKFLLSGFRKHTKDAVTYLKNKSAVVRSHEGEKTYEIPSD